MEDTTSTTVLIRSIGRATLPAAIDSALAEELPVLVVSDGVELDAAMTARYASSPVRFVKLGRRWGFYGSMAINVGAAMVESEFFTMLDDDDTFVPGAGKIIRERLAERRDVDIWIPTLVYKDGKRACFAEGGVASGNVAVPTYRASIFTKIPMTHNIPGEAIGLIDYLHIWLCQNSGYEIDWFGSDIINVRPAVGGNFGRGELVR